MAKAKPTFYLRPLKWKQVPTGFVAKTVLGWLFVEWFNREQGWQFDHNFDRQSDPKPVKSLMVGKKRAWEFYQERMLPALKAVEEEAGR